MGQTDGLVDGRTLDRFMTLTACYVDRVINCSSGRTDRRTRKIIIVVIIIILVFVMHLVWINGADAT